MLSLWPGKASFNIQIYDFSKQNHVVVVVVVVVAPLPRISWSSHSLTPQRRQSRFPLLDYLCCF